MLKHILLLCAVVFFAIGGANLADAKPHKVAPVVAPAVAAEQAAPAAIAGEKPDETHHEEEATGLPQMDVSRFPGQIFWLVITFIMTYLLMKHVALPGVERTLEIREKRISADIGGSKAKNEAAKHLMAEYQARLAKARSDAQSATRAVTEENAQTAAAALQAQTAKVHADIQSADARILAEKNKAITALDKEVVSVVAALVKSVANIAPSSADIESALKKVRGV
ncbi:MAG: hypothetical protein EB059_00305 [Alphaproteobacteria bacterium]|nr:hypothetical protein [Alphaproteobacteria bacterium]